MSLPFFYSNLPSPGTVLTLFHRNITTFGAGIVPMAFAHYDGQLLSPPSLEAQPRQRIDLKLKYKRCFWNSCGYLCSNKPAGLLGHCHQAIEAQI
jgi:hypothetical protein